MKSKKVINPHLVKKPAGFAGFLKWQLGFVKEELPEVPEGFHYPVLDEFFNPNQPQAVWINHSTFLITLGTIHILTDPIWSSRCSPLKWMGPTRRHPPGMSIDDLPWIDVILISHNHYDHLDKTTIHKLKRKFPTALWVVPFGLAKWCRREQIANYVELKWWESHTFELDKKSIRIDATPAQHFSGRKIHDRDRSLWVGYSVQCDKKKFYFAGDTGYNPVDFKEIGNRLGPFDLSLIPIGSYLPRSIMKSIHVDPYEASLIHREIQSKRSIAMHFKTFNLGAEHPDLPPYDLFKSLEEQGIPWEEFLVLEPGMKINW